MRSSLLLLLAFPSLASAVPLQFSHQGRLMGATGAPLDGQHQLSVALYDDPSGTTSLWGESHPSVDFTDGYFHIEVGSNTTMDSAMFDGDVLYLGLSVDGGPELPSRLLLLSVPYAVRAQDATNVSGGGIVDASEIRIDGTTVIDGSGGFDWDDLTGVPASIDDGVDDDTLASLGCSGGDLAIFDGSAWQCGTLSAGSIDAGDIVSGTVDVNRLPVGDSSTDVAAGDHLHPFNEITGVAVAGQIPDLDAGKVATGTLALGRLPVGTGANQVAAGDHGHTAADVGAVAAGGGIPVGAVSAACDTSTDGTLRYDGTTLEFCTAGEWVAIDLNNQDGSSAARAGQSCLTLHNDFPSLPSGSYWVDPDLVGGTYAAREVWCDMSTGGGGWTMIANNDNSDTELSGCYAMFASDSSWACGSSNSGASADWAALASGIEFDEFVFAAYTGNFAVSSYQYMTWTSRQTIPSTTSAWSFNGNAFNQTLGDWSSLPTIKCTSGGRDQLQSWGVRTSHASSAYSGLPVAIVAADTNISNYQMSFTEHDAWQGGQSMAGLEDFQDGLGCGDGWAPTADRGKSAFVMVR